MQAIMSDSTDQRPPSECLVDLHISVVPMDHWIEKLNSASQTVIGDTFSAGFIRVLPETSVARLRRDIKEQLGSELFPKDYVFLKHVGRCLALVRQTQERQLKVKNFLPPCSVMPEIFVLPGQPTMYTYAVLPPIQPRLQDLHNSVSDLGSTVTTHSTAVVANELPPMQSSYKFENLNDSLSPRYSNNPMLRADGPVSLPQDGKSTGGQKRLQNRKSPLSSRIPSSNRRRDMKRQQRHVSGKSAYGNEADQSQSTTILSSEHRGRTTPGKVAEGLASTSYHQQQDEEESQTFVNTSHNMLEDRRPSHAKSVFREGPKKRRVRYNMPPQSNPSSQDNDMNDDTNPLPSHASHRGAGHHFTSNRKSPRSNSSLNSSPLQYNRNESSPTGSYPHSIPANYNGRLRKQFVDTSTHAFVHASNPPSWHTSNGDRFELEHENSPPSPNPHIPHPVHVMHVGQPDNVPFANGESQSFYHPDTKPSTLVDPTTGEKWNIPAVAIGREDLVKSNSANDDSGFVEHELSDSDESCKTRNKRQSFINAGDDSANQWEVQNEPDVAALEERLVRQSSGEQHTALNFDNHSLSATPHSWDGEEHGHEEPRSNSSRNRTSVVNANNLEVFSQAQQVVVVSNEERHRLSFTPKNENRDGSSEALPVQLEVQGEVQMAKEPEKQRLSSSSSHQLDFYDRSLAPVTTNQQVPLRESSDPDNEDKEGEEEPFVQEEGSRVSFSLSQQGYRIQNENKDESDDKNLEMKLDGDVTVGNVLHHDFTQDHESSEDSHQHNLDEEDEEDHSDSDGYESSVDEFQQELANMAARQLKTNQELFVGEDEHPRNATNPTATSLLVDRQEDSSSTTPLEETMHSLADDKENKNPMFFPAGKEILQRDSISGSSEVATDIKLPLNTMTNIVAFATTDSFNPTDMTRDGAIIDPTIQKIFEESAALEGGQSRGAPDGMPTQRKVNTGGADKPDKSIVDSLNDLHPNEPLNPLLQADILTLVDDRETESEASPSHDHDQLREAGSTENELSSAAPEAISSFPPKHSDQQLETVELNESERKNPNPSPVHLPKLTKPGMEQDEIQPLKTSDFEAEDKVTRNEHVERTSPVQLIQPTLKRLGTAERAKLWDQLQRVRSGRRKAEKDRQDLVKHAKVTTSKTNQKRSTVRDMWKKKFFEEKKKTLPLEDICRRLQAEVDSSHRQLVSAMEGTKPGGHLKKIVPILPPTVQSPSNKNNNTILATRLQHDMDNLRRRMEDAKIKLTGEIKLRHQAEQDVKTMRQELLAKKIRAHVAYRDISRAHPFSVKT